MAYRASHSRVSIVVPHLGNDAEFEDSLISVLENRPADSEVWVAHDGHYQDPFDLGDEVRFITNRSNSLPELIGCAAEAVSGRFVHVISSGVRATEGWIDAALEKFEHDDAAIVAPVARQSVGGTITSAGWTSTTARLAEPLAAGKNELGRRDAGLIRGACLAASFWRRDELRSATRALSTDSLSAAQFGWSRLLCRRGWRCLLSEESVVLANASMLGLSPSIDRGVTLRSLESQIEGISLASSAVSVGFAAIGNLLHPSFWGEVTGEAISLVHRSNAVRSLYIDEIQSPQDVMATIRLPQSLPTDTAKTLRRAA